MRLLRKYIGRCLCKRVDVYIITLLCTWRIYALSERLLVYSHVMLVYVRIVFRPPGTYWRVAKSSKGKDGQNVEANSKHYSTADFIKLLH